MSARLSFAGVSLLNSGAVWMALAAAPRRRATKGLLGAYPKPTRLSATETKALKRAVR